MCDWSLRNLCQDDFLAESRLITTTTQREIDLLGQVVSDDEDEVAVSVSGVEGRRRKRERRQGENGETLDERLERMGEGVNRAIEEANVQNQPTTEAVACLRLHPLSSLTHPPPLQDTPFFLQATARVKSSEPLQHAARETVLHRFSMICEDHNITCVCA